MSPLKVTKTQLALFLDNLPKRSVTSIQLATSLKENLKLNDWEIVPLPFNEEAPVEIPRVIIQSADKKDSGTITGDRLDIHLFNKENLGNDVFVNSNLKLFQLLKGFLETNSLEIIRIGFILNTEAKVKDASKAIHDYYFKEEELKDASELILRYVRKAQIAGKESNIVINLSPKGSGLSLDKTSLFAQFDLNTTPFEKPEIITNVFNQFISEASKLAVKLVSTFPKIDVN